MYGTAASKDNYETPVVKNYSSRIFVMFFFFIIFCILARPLSSSADVKTRGFVSLMVADSCEPVQVGGWGQNGGFSCYGNGAAHFFFLSRVGKPVRWFATVEVAAAVAHIKLVRSISELLPHCSLCYLVLCVCVCVHIYIYFPFVAMPVTFKKKFNLTSTGWR
ncbi:Uncharacterized protein APZ42_029482 [Daphnia magna]|uniref:Uncharacterized protein n=1 Tax=Daphnia magna TaxID=35525 RepID=A0A164PKP4_9CRUS|nr:Uncharacterized protein APZ42_029482 [Daphnia magna]